jgi:hypothetical protein
VEEYIRFPFQDIAENCRSEACGWQIFSTGLAQVGRTDDAQKSLEGAMNVARELKNQATIAEIQGT